MRYQTDREMFTQEDSQLPSASEALEFLSKHPGIEYVDLLIIDMNGIVRGKRIEKNKLAAAYDHGIGMPLSIFGMDITGTSVEETGLGIEIGESDAFCYPVGGTLSMHLGNSAPSLRFCCRCTKTKPLPSLPTTYGPQPHCA